MWTECGEYPAVALRRDLTRESDVIPIPGGTPIYIDYGRRELKVSVELIVDDAGRECLEEKAMDGELEIDIPGTDDLKKVVRSITEEALPGGWWKVKLVLAVKVEKFILGVG